LFVDLAWIPLFFCSIWHGFLSFSLDGMDFSVFCLDLDLISVFACKSGMHFFAFCWSALISVFFLFFEFGVDFCFSFLDLAWVYGIDFYVCVVDLVLISVFVS